MMHKEKEFFDEEEELTLADARKMYSPKVIDHFMHPRNYGELEKCDGYTLMSGICGDTVGIFVAVERGRIARVCFVTNGCGPVTACASALTCMAEGLSVSDAVSITSRDLIAYLDGLPVENTHCADLAVNTLKGALAKIDRGKEES
jgi:nitrogen fixation NifU-like protein